MESLLTISLTRSGFRIDLGYTYGRVPSQVRLIVVWSQFWSRFAIFQNFCAPKEQKLVSALLSTLDATVRSNSQTYWSNHFWIQSATVNTKLQSLETKHHQSNKLYASLCSTNRLVALKKRIRQFYINRSLLFLWKRSQLHLLPWSLATMPITIQVEIATTCK